MNTVKSTNGRLRPPHVTGGAAGFTLIELAVVMSILSVLIASAAGGWTRYQRNVEHRGTAQELVSALRSAQQASLAEAVTYCVSFDTTTRSYQLYKFTCGASGSLVGSPRSTQSERVDLAGPSFLQSNGTTAATVSFFPRGSATKGSVEVTRADADRTYTISVEGLTGRVSLSG